MTLVRRGSAQVACFFDRLAEANAIVEWVDDRHLHHSPFHLLETWPVMPIFFVVELAMQGRDLSHIDINDGNPGYRRRDARSNGAPTHREDLHVYRSARLDAMLPIDLAAEEIDVKLTGLFQRENPENRGDALKFNCHLDLARSFFQTVAN